MLGYYERNNEGIYYDKIVVEIVDPKKIWKYIDAFQTEKQITFNKKKWHINRYILKTSMGFNTAEFTLLRRIKQF